MKALRPIVRAIWRVFIVRLSSLFDRSDVSLKYDLKAHDALIEDGVEYV